MCICFKIICDPGEGRNRVLGHWACYKVETSTADEADTARQVHHCILCSVSIPFPKPPVEDFMILFSPQCTDQKSEKMRIVYAVQCTL